MNTLYELGCEGCPSELIDEMTSLQAFRDRCPLDAPDMKIRRKWERTLSRGGNCALRQTVEVINLPNNTQPEQSL